MTPDDPPREVPSDAQLTDEQRHNVDNLYAVDRAGEDAEDKRTEAQPVEPDPAQTD